MKKILLVLGLILTAAAFGQYGGGNYANGPQYWPSSHPAHASYAPIAQEQSLIANSAYSSAQGERPASDFPQPAQKPLGDIARELKKQHAQVKKARVVWEN